MTDSPMPDPETRRKLDRAAALVTAALDEAWQQCAEEGIGREIFSASVMATLLQALESSFGGNAVPALEQMLDMARAEATAGTPSDGTV